VNFTHDINPGNGPMVSPVDSGNGFGKMVFWTAVIPDSDVQVNSLAGTARLHVRGLPELDYYSPEGNGDLASLGPTWQSGYFDSTVSIDVVWNRPVTRLVNVRDAANGFAGIFAENQATVTWSVQSASGFTFTSNPGDFSTSVPEIPGVNGVTVPLNFFAQVGFERNGIFFPQGQYQVRAGIPSAADLEAVAFAPRHRGAWDGLGGHLTHAFATDVQAMQGQLPAAPAPYADRNNGHRTQAWPRSSQMGTRASQIGGLDQVFSDWERDCLGDYSLESDALAWHARRDSWRLRR
jgi:hypothetical protein